MNSETAPTGVRFVEIDSERAGQRLDNFLLSSLKGIPRSLVYRIVRKGEVRVNKGRAKVDYRLKSGDRVRIPPLRLGAESSPPAASRNLRTLLARSILYEDKGLLILNKPSGLAVHGGSGVNLGMIEALRQLRETDPYLELVHRLDRDTSGCIMVARKRSVLRHLHGELRNGGVQKIYHALVAGQWPASKTKVDAPLRKNELQSGERIVKVDPQGKASLTRFRVLQQFDGCSLVEAMPVTGRTHQIRVHARHAGHPLVGDEKYGDESVNRRLKTLGCQRLFLHAAALSFRLSDSAVPITVRAPLDDQLQALVKTLSGEENS